jgi:5-methyltetrahydropteroyltriglutamate--homocysteine methyltransferase
MSALRTQPPFRADHVGSLLRPPDLLAARERHEQGRIGADELRAVEDAAIRRIVRLQEDVGLQGVTDGEYRRRMWNFDFLQQIGGVERGAERAIEWHGAAGAVTMRTAGLEVTAKLTLDEPIFADHFRFLAATTRRVPKFCIPGPTNLYRNAMSSALRNAYADPDAFARDISTVYADEIAALGRLGCTYLQLDDTAFAGINDPNERDRLRQSGVELDGLNRRYIRLINDALAKKPPQMTVCVHSCRGNHRSLWRNAGGYDAVAEALFSELDVTGFFLEYDDERSGGFEPLRFVPSGKFVVLGLVTTKRGALESKDELKRRIDAATRFVPLERLCLSPQCGFSSVVEGNELAEDEELAKLRLVVETADEIWG